MTEQKLKKLETEVSFLRDAPFTLACGSQSTTFSDSQTITYDTLLHFSSNVEGASLDISNGVFMAGHAGSYTVTWSLWSNISTGDSPEHNVEIHLRKNGENLAAARHVSTWSGPSGTVNDQG